MAINTVSSILNMDENPSNEEVKTSEIDAQKPENEAAEAPAEDVPAEVEKPAETAEMKPEEAPAAEAEKPAEKSEDAPPEPVVAADAGELEREAKAEPDPQPTRSRRRRPQAEPEPEARQTRQLIDNVGTVSQDIEEEEARRKSDAEIENDTYNQLRTFARNKEIVWGTVYGCEENERWPNHAIVTVLYNNVKVMIPDIAYFEDSFNFGPTYDSAPEAQKFARRQTMIRYQAGAKVCFIVKDVAREMVKAGEFAGSYLITASGSRKEAMALLRDIWFIHSNRSGSTPGKPRQVNVGDIADARVLSVRQDMVLVECLGVETRIDTYNLNNDIVENCADFVKPGDTIPVRIRKLHVQGDRVYLTVSGRLNDVSKAILTMRPNSYYIGHVDHYNKDKQMYTIMLMNGVSAAVRKDNVLGGLELSNGDMVSVLVTRIMPTYVFGVANKR